ncbi:PREDICTED: uncharacterized protein LOC109216575 [Nicotiana attenuata]|uniref:uncharacterized protein LOC109216575 n=1 Tax=Nicotiana attenuata TaxID=49451 RepID=UPI000904ACD5|nr:PREDICTED: uncharacterized protein LOC109216575 [Nicotiana attenuata]
MYKVRSLLFHGPEKGVTPIRSLDPFWSRIIYVVKKKGVFSYLCQPLLSKRESSFEPFLYSQMAVSSIANLFSFFTTSKPPTPKTTLLQFSADSLSSSSSSSSSSSPNQEGNLLPLISTNDHNNHTNPLPLSSSSSSNSDITSVVCPSLAYASTLFFRSAYNVQVIVDDNEHEEKLIGRFRREVMRAGVIQECKRRRFFENTQDKDKRKTREAAKRNRRRRGLPPSRNFGQDKQETSKNKRNDDDGDNWELPDGGIPN